jgi:dTDP-4-amino-4,6-dideoxygalactose transaminase
VSSLAILGGRPLRSRPFGRWPVFDEKEKRALEEVLESGVWGGYHPKVAEFENTFAHFHGAAHGVATANGTVSLEAALAAGGVGPQDEVIVPPITFIATATAVLRAGAVPVFADIGPDYNLDPARVREAITPRTRALIPVHFAGRPADMDSLGAIAAEHGLIFIEDAAHAHGASWKGQRVGTFGHLASFSFQQSKNVTAGEGGILIGNDRAFIESARSVCNQGRRTGGAWFEHVRLGTNYRMTGWQAAILLVQLSRLEEQLRCRAQAARILDERLAQFEFLEAQPRDARVTCHGYYLYMIRLLPHRLGGIPRDVFMKALRAEGIPGLGGYPYPLYGNKVFDDARHRRQDCPEAERMCRESFWVSHEIMLSKPEDLEDFVRAVAKVAENAAALAQSQEVLHRA